MPKYTKFTRKKYMKKHKRGRTQRGGYLFYPGPGDDVHAFEGAYTNLKDRVSSFVPSFPNLNPLSYFRTGPPIAAAPVAVDYAPAPAPAPAAAAAADKPLVGNLEYQSNGDFKADSPMNVEAEAGDAGAEAGAEAGDAGDGAGDAGDGAGDADDARDKQAGGRRRRRRRTTKKRKRSNKRKRTMKRRRSMRRRR